MNTRKPNLGVYVLFALFFGGIGLHRFYEGKVLSGIFMLLF
ncbi:NINE protein [Bacillus thuringiensis]|nr:NINE protein [Bacillus thuringiensis]